MLYDLFYVLLNLSLLIFCSEFLLYSSKILACNFLGGGMSLHEFGIGVTVASQNVFGCVPSSSAFWNNWRRIGVSSLYTW